MPDQGGGLAALAGPTGSTRCARRRSSTVDGPPCRSGTLSSVRPSRFSVSRGSQVGVAADREAADRAADVEIHEVQHGVAARLGGAAAEHEGAAVVEGQFAQRHVEPCAARAEVAGFGDAFTQAVVVHQAVEDRRGLGVDRQLPQLGQRLEGDDEAAACGHGVDAGHGRRAAATVAGRRSQRLHAHTAVVDGDALSVGGHAPAAVGGLRRGTGGHRRARGCSCERRRHADAGQQPAQHGESAESALQDQLDRGSSGRRR